MRKIALWAMSTRSWNSLTFLLGKQLWVKRGGFNQSKKLHPYFDFPRDFDLKWNELFKNVWFQKASYFIKQNVINRYRIQNYTKQNMHHILNKKKLWYSTILLKEYFFVKTNKYFSHANLVISQFWLAFSKKRISFLARDS